jgi:uncharacterized protein
VYADELIRPWFDQLSNDLHLSLFDAHTHIGSNDPDGFRCNDAQLLSALELAHAKAVVFPMHEPDGYRAANDRVIECAQASGGVLKPFCRVDPHHGAAAEVERCLRQGALGVKLHPRAERFALLTPGVEEVFAIANERKLPVLVHAGRGIPALGNHALELCAKFPEARLILAHAGICDLAWIWRYAADHPNLFFDTAWWKASDLLALFSAVAPGQILFASDLPYGTELASAVNTFRCALEAGLSEAQIQSVAGGQLQRLLNGQSPLDMGPAPGDFHFSLDVFLERVHSFLTTAMARMLIGESGHEYLSLARLACSTEEHPGRGEICGSVLSLLDRFDHYNESQPNDGRYAAGMHLVSIAATVARTPSVAVPDASDDDTPANQALGAEVDN